MAVDPKARKVTLSYEGGTATAPLGLFQSIFGNFQPRWTPTVSGINGITGRKRFKYGRRQRALASGGRELFVVTDQGEEWTVRVTGEDNAFIDQILARADNNKVLNVYTKRGTIYGPQYFPPGF